MVGIQAAASLPRQMEQQALATFVASVESRYTAVPEGAEPERRRERRFGVMLVSALSLAALAIHGYHPYAEDGGLYLAGVERLMHPELFPHGTAFVLEPTRYSLFAATVAGIVRVTRLGLAPVLLGLHFASIWATLFAIWMLASRCWANRAARTGAAMLLACWLSLPVAGTALALMDPYLTARSISTPCMIFALVGMLDATAGRAGTRLRIRGAMLCAGSLSIAALVHPLMAAYALAGVLSLACMRSQIRAVRLWGTCLLGVGAFALASFTEALAAPETAAYRRIALTRTYWFPAQWSWYELIGLIAPLAILAAYAVRPRSRADVFDPPDASGSLCTMALAAGSTALLVVVCFARSDASSFVLARLQPLRIFQIVYVVMTLTLGALLGEYVCRRRVSRWIAAVALLGGIMFSAAQHTYPNSPHLELPRSAVTNPWVDAFLWIRSDTPLDAVFALDPDYIHAANEDAQCFRAIAERSALPDYSKDGGEASIAPELTEAWTAGQREQQGLNAASTTDAMRIAALETSGASWVVLSATTSTGLNCPYTNSAVKVCRLH